MQLEAKLAEIPDAAKFFSGLAPIEVRSAITRRLRGGEITTSESQTAMHSLVSIEARFTPWRVEPILPIARHLVELHGLRTLDALHLASAIQIRSYLLPSDTLLFIASDTRLLAAATAEKLPTWNPS